MTTYRAWNPKPLDRNELLRDVLSALADIRVPIYTMNARQVENNCAVVLSLIHI